MALSPEPRAGELLSRLSMGGYLLAAERQTSSLAESHAREASLGLLAQQGAFLRACFHLQRSERRLFEHTKRRGGHALRQVERERQRLGRELHTGVGQALAAIRMQLEVIAAFSVGEPIVQQSLDRISRLAEDALSQVRSVSHRIHPPEWQSLTLETALRSLWDLSGIPQSYQATLFIEPAGEPGFEVKVLLYRALQEGLSNLVRHARATRVHVCLRRAGGSLTLIVEDNGIGFDTVRVPAVAAGLGLRSIREQALELGGKLIVESGPHGTKLEVTVPYSRPYSGNDR